VAITVVGTPQAAAAMDGTDVTLTFDVAPQDGDVTVLAGGHFNRGPLGPVTAGYTAAHASTAQNPYFGVWYKRQGATPDANVVGEGSGAAQDGAAYIALVLRGVDATTPLDVAAQAVASTDPAAITTATADAFILVATGTQSGDNTPGGITGYTVTDVATVTDTNRIMVRGAYKTRATAGTEDPPQWDGWTPDPGNSYSVTVAFRPTGGGTPTGSGTIGLTYTLGGSGQKQATGSGMLGLTESLTGSGARTTTASGTTTAAYTLGGTGSKRAAGSGTVGLTETLGGSGQVVGGTPTGAGTAGITWTLTGTGQKRATSAGSLSLTHTLTGTAQRRSTSTGTIGLTLTLGGTGASADNLRDLTLTAEILPGRLTAQLLDQRLTAETLT